MTPATERVGTVLDGKLRIERNLASGAAGDVYEAHHLGLGTQVAVKVLRPGGGETADIRRRRFLREARVAARLHSPHVVRVFDIVAPEGGQAYIVMELLRGETLAERVARDGALPVTEAVELLRQAAHALGEMHAAGIIHRDVKPSNLFLAKEADGTQRVKLLDFGVAALRQPLPSDESSITFTEAFLGTPRYMAPEQVRSSRTVDARADVWALSVTLHELLSGKPPFDGQTVIVVLNQIERGPPPDLAQLRPGLPAGLVALVRRGMSRDPDHRPADAKAFGEALVPYGNRPAHAQVGRWRSRVAIVSASVVAAIIVVLVGFRRSGDARPSTAADLGPVPAGDVVPAVPPSAPSTSPLPSPPPPAPSVPMPQPAPPSRLDPAARPRPRPAPARPVTPPPSRPNDDRIE